MGASLRGWPFHQRYERAGELWEIQIHLRVDQLHIRIGLERRGPGQRIAIAWTMAQINIHVKLALSVMIAGFSQTVAANSSHR